MVDEYPEIYMTEVDEYDEADVAASQKCIAKNPGNKKCNCKSLSIDVGERFLRLTRCGSYNQRVNGRILEIVCGKRGNPAATSIIPFKTASISALVVTGPTNPQYNCTHDGNAVTVVAPAPEGNVAGDNRYIVARGVSGITVRLTANDSGMMGFFWPYIIPGKTYYVNMVRCAKGIETSIVVYPDIKWKVNFSGSNSQPIRSSRRAHGSRTESYQGGSGTFSGQDENTLGQLSPEDGKFEFNVDVEVKEGGLASTNANLREKLNEVKELFSRIGSIGSSINRGMRMIQEVGGVGSFTISPPAGSFSIQWGWEENSSTTLCDFGVDFRAELNLVTITLKYDLAGLVMSKIRQTAELMERIGADAQLDLRAEISVSGSIVITMNRKIFLNRNNPNDGNLTVQGQVGFKVSIQATLRILHIGCRGVTSLRGEVIGALEFIADASGLRKQLKASHTGVKGSIVVSGGIGRVQRSYNWNKVLIQANENLGTYPF